MTDDVSSDGAEDEAAINAGSAADDGPRTTQEGAITDGEVSDEDGISAHPESLVDREDVPVSEEERDVDGETFELFERFDGVAALGIEREDGALLLWEGPHGWTLPFAFVEPDDDWSAAARGVIAELTGVSFEIAGIEALRQFENVRTEEEDRVTSYEVVYRARTVTDETVVRELAAFEADEDHPDVEWFHEVPERVDNEADVRLFLDE